MPPFDTFNLGDHVGDDPAAVAANRIRLAAAIGLGPDRMVWMNQVHSDHIKVVDGPRENAFDDTTYQKGGSVIAMFERRIAKLEADA